MSWTSTQFPDIKAYDFDYDGLNRLTNANFANNDLYTTSYGYDLNGNIERLSRNMDIEGMAGEIDLLDYQYNGNQLVYSFIMVISILTYSYRNNQFHLSKFVLNKNKTIIQYSIKKFDKVYMTFEIEIENINLRIVQKTGVYRTFQLEIKHYDFKFTQKALGGWNENMFIQLVTEVNKCKGKPSYLTYVKP